MKGERKKNNLHIFLSPISKNLITNRISPSLWSRGIRVTVLSNAVRPTGFGTITYAPEGCHFHKKTKRFLFPYGKTDNREKGIVISYVMQSDYQIITRSASGRNIASPSLISNALKKVSMLRNVAFTRHLPSE